MARGGLGDAGVVGRGREGDVEFFVAGFGGGAVGVDEEEGAPRGVPAWGFALVFRAHCR